VAMANKTYMMMNIQCMDALLMAFGSSSAGMENQSTTDNKPMAISAILIILFMITDSFRFVRLFLVGGQHINQGNGGVFHVVYDTIDFRDDIVIENLKDDGNDQT